MYFGEHERTVDAKGRLTLPSHVLATSQDADWSRVVIVKGEGPSLFLYDACTWQNVLSTAYRALDDEDARLFMHRNLPDAQLSELDSLNRITLPGTLLTHAGIEKRVALIGLFNRIELWDPETWTRYVEQRKGVEVPSVADVSRASIREVS
jgi:MraZ protein